MDETIALLFINMNFSWSCSSWSKSSMVLRKRERTEKKPQTNITIYSKQNKYCAYLNYPCLFFFSPRVIFAVLHLQTVVS